LTAPGLLELDESTRHVTDEELIRECATRTRMRRRLPTRP